MKRVRRKSPENLECCCETCIHNNKASQPRKSQTENIDIVAETNDKTKDHSIPEKTHDNKEVIVPVENVPNVTDNILSKELPTDPKTVDVLLHDTPTTYLVTSYVTPPPPGFIIPPPPSTLNNFQFPYNHPRFPTGGNVEDLLGEVEMGPNVISTEFIQENSIFMCNTKKIIHRRQPCQCQTQEQNEGSSNKDRKCYITEKNIELNYDYPRAVTPITNRERPIQTTQASTVVFLERRIPVRPKGKYDFLFRSQSAPVGENDEPIYATVKKLPKRIRKMDLTNLENEVAYKNGDAIQETSQTDRTDTEDSRNEDDASRSENEKQPPPKRPDTPKAKKRRRFSFRFKRRDRKKREETINKDKEIRDAKNGVTNHINESDSEKPVEVVEENRVQNAVCFNSGRPRTCRHVRPRTITSSVSSGPRYKRDSLQDITSQSDRERTNSASSSLDSACSISTRKSRKTSAAPDTAIPWCGCWGTGCL